MSRSFTVALIAAGLVLATSGCAAGVDGEKTFNERCLTCHTISEVDKRLERLAPGKCVEHLEGFLTKHHAPDRAERTTIIAYLNEQICKQR